MMRRRSMMMAAIVATAMIGSSGAQATIRLGATSGIIKQLHSNSIFTNNNFGFALCNGDQCDTLFVGVSGLRQLSNLEKLNDWADTGQYAGTGGYFDNYQFTFSGVGSYFGNKKQQRRGHFAPPPEDTPPPAISAPPIPEPATWAMMIFGFGVVGMAMRRRAVRSNFA